VFVELPVVRSRAGKDSIQNRVVNLDRVIWWEAVEGQPKRCRVVPTDVDVPAFEVALSYDEMLQLTMWEATRAT
jgi:hypothetical protein